MPDIVLISVLSCASIFLVFSHFKNKPKAISMEASLREITARLASEPDDPMLHMLSAELLVRDGARWSALKSLESAFNLGLPLEEIEPTFWECYSDFKPGPPLWRRFQNECPNLIGRIGIGMSQCEARYRARMSDAITASDQIKRQAILSKSDLPRLGAGNE